MSELFLPTLSSAFLDLDSNVVFCIRYLCLASNAAVVT